jgi:predicted PurR-regulated permease PerM
MGDSQQRRATRGRCLLRDDWDLFDSVCSGSVFGTSSIDSGRCSDNRMTLAPLSRRAAHYHCPAWLFAILVVGVLVANLQLSTLLFFAPIAQWIDRLPELSAIIRDKSHKIEGASTIILQAAISTTGGGSGFKIDVSSFMEPIVGFLTPAVSQLIIFLATLFLFLISQAELRRSVILVFSGQEARLRTTKFLNEIESDLARYIATVSVVISRWVV